MTKVYYDENIASIRGMDVLIFLEDHNKGVIRLAKQCIKDSLDVVSCLGTKITPDKEHLDKYGHFVVVENGTATFGYEWRHKQ